MKNTLVIDAVHFKPFVRFVIFQTTEIKSQFAQVFYHNVEMKFSIQFNIWNECFQGRYNFDERLCSSCFYHMHFVSLFANPKLTVLKTESQFAYDKRENDYPWKTACFNILSDNFVSVLHWRKGDFVAKGKLTHIFRGKQACLLFRVTRQEFCTWSSTNLRYTLRCVLLIKINVDNEHTRPEGTLMLQY